MDKSGFDNGKHECCEKVHAVDDELLEAPSKLLFIPQLE
jgi:hypothetical protein